MKVPIYQVDAFAGALFRGNPAAICPLDRWLPDETLQSIALENNLAETAYYVPTGPERYHLRWFTPEVEVDLCGHATVATAAVIFDLRKELNGTRVVFETLSGDLPVEREGDLFSTATLRRILRWTGLSTRESPTPLVRLPRNPTAGASTCACMKRSSRCSL